MAQKKKVPSKAQSKKAAHSKPKTRSIATKAAIPKKTSTKAAASVKATPKATAAKSVAPAKAVKPVAQAVKPAQAKAAAGKSSAPKSVAKVAAKVEKQPARSAVAAAAKPASPQVKAPSQKAAGTTAPAVAAGVKPAPQKVQAPATPKDIAARTAEATRQATPPSPAVAAANAAAMAAVQAAAAATAAGGKKIISQRHGFKTNEYVVYPAHGVGRIVGIEEQEIAGMALELFVIQFDKDKMTVRVPTGKLQSVGMRKLADDGLVGKALDTLKGRARVKRTMWSRRAQEYEAKINSGDLISIAEVVRDLYRSESQPEQSYSERQLYEAALDRMAREIAAVERLDDRGAVQRITDVLAKSARGRRTAAEGAAAEGLDADVKAA